MQATYFLLPEKHPDVLKGVDGTIVTGLVEPRLGPDGWPVVSKIGRAGKTAAGPTASGPITDVNASGEILWWSTTSTHGVKLEKTGAACMPFENHSMFADGHTDDATNFLTAQFHGVFTVPSSGKVGFSLGSDDDSWVFIDGALTVDNGGVKPEAVAPYKSAELSPGQHQIDVFYADRHPSGAVLVVQPGFPVTAAAPSAVAPTPTAAPIAKQLKTQKRIRIYGIHFDVDKATIQPQSEKVIAQIASVMRDNPAWRFRVEGHTDSDGGYDHNMTLSQNRAQAVVDDLVNRYHIARSRLVAVGYGYSRPVAPNTTAKNKALNRRVELVRL
ncbi:MAG: OmpA family protein [Candidatus Eremiobacteraeota bacterium]|nr:OmpA family protein [Candidatus Eremiobacteraeota bacterium]